MALLAAIATGNAGDAATWGEVDATSYLATETACALTTSYVTQTVGGLFTPGAITIDGIGVKLAVRTGVIGTISVALEQAGSTVAGTEVAINCSDLPVATTADLSGGWIFFKFASPVLLTAATAYGVRAKTSSSTQVSLFGTATTNLSRFLRTTTTQAPVAGDEMIIAKVWTAAATGTAVTVTWNITASTDFGSSPTAANSLITPGIAICNGGTLSCGTTAATAYVMTMSNSIIVYSGGTLNFGTSGTPVPSGSSFTLTFDCGANVDYGLVVRNLGTWNAYGTKGFTSSPSNHYTLLTADEAVGQTVIGSVGDTTGWGANDEVFFSSTTQTASQAQHCKIATIDSSTAFTLTTSGTLTTGDTPANLAVAKAGVVDAQGNDVRCEIGNLTRNVVIRGASVTLQSYINISGTALVNISKAEFYWLGSATSTKQGIYAGTTTGTFVMTLCSLHNFEVNGSVGVYLAAATGGGTITVTKNVIYLTANWVTTTTTTGTWTITYNLMCRATAQAVTLGDIGGVFANNVMTGQAGSSANVCRITEINGAIGTFDSNTIRCGNGDPALYMGTAISGEISNLKLFRNLCNNANSGAIQINAPAAGLSRLLISTLTCFDNTASNVTVIGGVVRFASPNIQAGATYPSSYGIRFGSPTNSTTGGHLSDVIVENGLIGNVTANSVSDVSSSATYSGQKAVFHNCTFGTNGITGVTTYGIDAYICSLRHNATAGDHRTWKSGGRSADASLLIDTVIYNTASPSLSMYPGSASLRLESSAWAVAVASGSTLTPSVLVRYSKAGDAGGVDYVPTTAPRLVVRRNVAAGITADTVLATHGGGADWVTLSGTTVSVTDDAILEFFVDCDGTTGWINVDDFSCVGANPGGMKYWSPRYAGPLALGLPAGGGLIGGGNLSGGFQ